MESEVSLLYKKYFLLVAVLSQINPFHTTPSYLSQTHFNIIHLPAS
jgi:hypothetical protein